MWEKICKRCGKKFGAPNSYNEHLKQSHGRYEVDADETLRNLLVTEAIIESLDSSSDPPSSTCGSSDGSDFTGGGGDFGGGGSSGEW